jgi:glycosyltransferase involved in cell wall biosynthesis
MRCCDSLTKQTYKDFIWVIVNDNGNIDEVNKIVDVAESKGINTIVIHRDVSCGVSAAANHGIVATSSEFIHIHDDDDTLEPTFYNEAISFLDSKPNYMGVTSNTRRINEEVSDYDIKLLSISPYTSLDSTVYLADLLWKNQFTTISFLYRRKIFDVIEAYDQNLPALEDWDFNIRFCEKFDIGVIPKPLANYHFRNGIQTGGTAQTISTGSMLHQEYTAILRNKMLRKDLEGGKAGIGALMTLGRFHQLQNNKLKLMDDKFEAQMLLRNFLKKIASFFHL